MDRRLAIVCNIYKTLKILDLKAETRGTFIENIVMIACVVNYIGLKYIVCLWIKSVKSNHDLKSFTTFFGL